jgi:type IV pilus assembly protein PilF
MSIVRIAWITMLALVMIGCASTPEPTATRTGMDRVSPVRGAEVNTRLGIGYLERGEYRTALEKLQTALGHDPDHVPAHLGAALIYEQIGDSGRAGQHYRRAVRLAPNDGGTLNSYGVFLCRQGDYRLAEQQFMAAVRDPFYDTPEVAWANAGACARRSGELETANQHLRRAIDIDPQYPDPLFHLAEIHYQQGEAFRARAFLQRFESVANPEPGALLLGYRIEHQLDNPADASEYANRLEREFPDSRQARELRRELHDDD